MGTHRALWTICAFLIIESKNSWIPALCKFPCCICLCQQGITPQYLGESMWESPET